MGPDLGGIAAVTDAERLPYSPVLNGRAIRVLPSERPAKVFPGPRFLLLSYGESAALVELSASR